jgi:hypothetical protein
MIEHYGVMNQVLYQHNVIFNNVVLNSGGFSLESPEYDCGDRLC